MDQFHYFSVKLLKVIICHDALKKLPQIEDFKSNPKRAGMYAVLVF